MAERGAVGRLFHAFANAVLERTLPTVREWLTSKLGPSATVEAMRLDGSRVHLTNARLPIGPNAILEVDEATFIARVGDGPPMRLERLEGRLTVPGEQDELRFCAPLVLEGCEPPTGQEWVHGLVTVENAHWVASAGRDAQAPISGTVVVSVTSSAWSLVDGQATAADATIELGGSGRLDDEERGLEVAFLETHDARVGHVLDALFALSGRAPKIAIPLPWTGRCDGRLDLEGDRLEADFEVHTPASRLKVKAEIVSGRVQRAKLDGQLAWVDLLPVSWAERVEQGALVSCEGEISGPFDALTGEVQLTCPEVAVDALRESANARACLSLRGADGAEADLALVFDGDAGSLKARVRLDAEDRLDGTFEGRVHPSVLDLDLGVGAGACGGEALVVEGSVGGERVSPIVEVRATSEKVVLRRGATELALSEASFEAGFDGHARATARARLGSGTLRYDAVQKKLSMARVDGPSMVALARLAGIEWLRRGSESAEVALFALPDASEADAELSFGEFIGGELHIATADSRVSLDPLRYEQGRWDGSVLRGRLAAGDALTCGLFPGPFRPLPQGAVTLELPLFGAGRETYVEGRITTASLVWRLFEGAAPVTLAAAATGLRVDAEAVTLRDLEGSVFEGRVELDMRIAYPKGDEGMKVPVGRCVIQGARGGFGAWLAKMLGMSRLPTGLGLDAELETGESADLRGPVVLSNQRSRLTLALSLGPSGELDGTVLSGEISLLDAYELMPRGGPTVVGKGNIEIRASIEGNLRAPEASLKLSSDKPRLLFADKGSGVRVAFDRALARGRLNAKRLVWSELLIDGYGGRLRSQGLFGWGAPGAEGTGFRGLRAKLDLDDVRLDSLPLPGGGRLGTLLAGRLHGELTVRRPAGKRLSVKGPVWIDKPVFPALTRAEASLSKVGLRPPPITGTEPALATLKGGPHGWMLVGLDAAVPGARVEGDVALKPGGTLLGALTVSLEAAYLRSSALLRVPATMVGDVTLPVRLGGVLDDPVVEADLLGALDHMVQKSAVGRSLHRAVDTLMDGVLGERSERRKRHERSDDAALLPSDDLISRIARGLGDEDRYLDVLLERGLSPTEIADRIEAARRT